MGRRSEGALVHYRGPRLHDLGRSAANLLLTPKRCATTAGGPAAADHVTVPLIGQTAYRSNIVGT
jgi:hypothetical protein